MPDYELLGMIDLFEECYGDHFRLISEAPASSVTHEAAEGILSDGEAGEEMPAEGRRGLTARKQEDLLIGLASALHGCAGSCVGHPLVHMTARPNA